MNAVQVLELMLALVPQLDPILDGCNPDSQVLFNDGGVWSKSFVDGKWDMLDLTRQFNPHDIEDEDQMRKVMATYVPYAALTELQRGFEPALPPVIGNWFYNLMFTASWQLHAMTDQDARRKYADLLVAYINASGPENFKATPQKYFDAFKLGL